MNFTGEQLKMLRAIKNLNQKAIAKKSKMSQQAYSKWERKDEIPEHLFMRFAKAIGVTTSEIDFVLKQCLSK